MPGFVRSTEKDIKLRLVVTSSDLIGDWRHFRYGNWYIHFWETIRLRTRRAPFRKTQHRKSVEKAPMGTLEKPHMAQLWQIVYKGFIFLIHISCPNVGIREEGLMLLLVFLCSHSQAREAGLSQVPQPPPPQLSGTNWGKCLAPRESDVNPSQGSTICHTMTEQWHTSADDEEYIFFIVDDFLLYFGLTWEWVLLPLPLSQ